ncbi:hypothetical protein QNM99_17610 [Pseudomonas sp. PCH446]
MKIASYVRDQLGLNGPAFLHEMVEGILAATTRYRRACWASASKWCANTWSRK